MVYDGKEGDLTKRQAARKGGRRVRGLSNGGDSFIMNDTGGSCNSWAKDSFGVGQIKRRSNVVPCA